MGNLNNELAAPGCGEVEALWFESATELTRGLVEASEEDAQEEGLDIFVTLARDASRATCAAVYLPSIGGEWICEAASGKEAHRTLGARFDAPAGVTALLAEGKTVPAGQTIYAPIFARGRLEGCLVMTREAEAAPFRDAEAQRIATYTQTGALALELISARQAQSFATLLEERERISRDLHDLGIQDLFATGMLLQALKVDAGKGLPKRALVERVNEVMDKLDNAVSQIRQIVHDLKDPDGARSLVDALHAEASLARTHLGFAPTLTLELDGEILESQAANDPQIAELVDERVNADLASDIIATVREALTNVAKHAGANSVRVSVRVHGAGPSGEVVMVIVDDGAGVDPSVTRSSGLSNMQIRAANHEGTFAVSSGPRGRGTSLVWRAPLN